MATNFQQQSKLGTEVTKAKQVGLNVTRNEIVEG